MRFCKRCLYPENHPLNIVFDDDGICSGCRVHEEKDQIDWSIKEKKLKSILGNYKNTSGNNYDCIIPVSGSRDSYFIVHIIKNIYGMNPLLVTYNKQYNTDIGIRNLANLRIKFDCDIMTLTVNPESVKKITRATIRKFGSIYWHCLAGQTVFPVQIAVKFKIPLIIWGAHQGVDQVGMFSHLDEVEMTRKYRKEHDLLGHEAEDLIDDFDEISKEDILQFIYPDDKEIERVGVRGIYLNNYIRWDSKYQHELMIEKYDYETRSLNRTFDKYNDIDCYNYSDLHDYIKYLKFGFGKITDHVCREIRLKRLTREEGLKIVKEYSMKEPIHMENFLKWIGISKNSFFYLIDQHRNKILWKKNDKWEWVFDPMYFDDLMKSGDKMLSLQLNEKECNFQQTKIKISSDLTDDYILIGKGV